MVLLKRKLDQVMAVRAARIRAAARSSLRNPSGGSESDRAGRLSDAPEALVGLLQDEDLAVRWAAMSSLIAYRCKGVRPLMLALTRDFHSINLRQGAHHVFKALADYGDLNQAEMDVFQALEHATPVLQIAQSGEPGIDYRSTIQP